MTENTEIAGFLTINSVLLSLSTSCLAPATSSPLLLVFIVFNWTRLQGVPGQALVQDQDPQQLFHAVHGGAPIM